MDHHAGVLSSSSRAGSARRRLRYVGGLAALAAAVAVLAGCEPAKPSAPGAPSSVSASVGDGQSTVTFTVPNNHGSPITGYNVTSNHGAVTSVATSSGHRLVTGLTNGISYTFQIQACNAIGCGPYSASTNAVVPFGAQAAPGLTAVTTVRQVQWTWTAPAENGRPVAGYRLRLDGTVIDESFAGNTYTRTFGYDETHTLEVTALNTAGAQSAPATSTAHTGAATGAPSLTIIEDVVLTPSTGPCVPLECHIIKSLARGAGAGTHVLTLHAVLNGTDRVIWTGSLGVGSGRNGLGGLDDAAWSDSKAYFQAAPGTDVYGVLDGYLVSNHLSWT